MTLNKSIKYILALISLSIVLVGCSTNDTDGSASSNETEITVDSNTIVYIGFVNSDDQPFWQILGNSLNEHATELDVSVTDLTPSEGDATKQLEAFNLALEGEARGIILGAVDSQAFGEVLDNAQEAGIPVITVDTGIDHSHVSALIQTDNYAAARLAGEHILDVTGGEGTVVIIAGSEAHQTGDARRDGVRDVVENGGMNTIVENGDWDGDKAIEIVIEALASADDVSAVFVAHDPSAIAVADYLATVEGGDTIAVIGFDALPLALSYIQAGNMNATIRQDPQQMGAQSLDVMLELLEGNEVDIYFGIAGTLIDTTNVADFVSE